MDSDRSLTQVIVPALSRRRACREQPLRTYVDYITHVVNVTSLTDVIVIRCICISICIWCV